MASVCLHIFFSLLHLLLMPLERSICQNLRTTFICSYILNSKYPHNFVHVLNNVRPIKRLAFLMDFLDFLIRLHRCRSSFGVFWTRNGSARFVIITRWGILRFARISFLRRFRVLVCLFASFPFHSSILKPYLNLKQDNSPIYRLSYKKRNTYLRKL